MFIPWRRRTEEQLETGEPDPIDQAAPARDARFVAGSLWMIGITLVFFFIPVINGIVGGLIGGYKVGTTKNAILVSLLPALAAAFLLWMLLTLIPLPIMGSPGSLAGITLAVFVILSDIGIIVGAAIGGTIAENKIDRLNRA